MTEELQLLMCVVIGLLCGAVMWRGDMLEAKEHASTLDRYRQAVSQLNIWCGHESPHARLIARHISAIGEGEGMNAGTPCGDEVCDVQGTREQLRRIDTEGAMGRNLSIELDAVAAAIGSPRWMDPPDGGSVPLSEQVRRMREELEGLQALMDDTEWLKAELAVRSERNAASAATSGKPANCVLDRT